jgi:hypothetical protein
VQGTGRRWLPAVEALARQIDRVGPAPFSDHLQSQQLQGRRDGIDWPLLAWLIARPGSRPKDDADREDSSATATPPARPPRVEVRPSLPPGPQAANRVDGAAPRAREVEGSQPCECPTSGLAPGIPRQIAARTGLDHLRSHSRSVSELQQRSVSASAAYEPAADPQTPAKTIPGGIMHNRGPLVRIPLRPLRRRGLGDGRHPIAAATSRRRTWADAPSPTPNRSVA